MSFKISSLCFKRLNLYAVYLLSFALWLFFYLFLFFYASCDTQCISLFPLYIPLISVFTSCPSLTRSPPFHLSFSASFTSCCSSSLSRVFHLPFLPNKWHIFVFIRPPWHHLISLFTSCFSPVFCLYLPCFLYLFFVSVLSAVLSLLLIFLFWCSNFSLDVGHLNLTTRFTHSFPSYFMIFTSRA